jgi:phage tail tape-measure protein
VTESGRPPGRAGLGMRDMVGAMVVLLVIVGVLVAVTRGCSFDPGAPSSDPATAPSVNVSAKLSQAASSVTFPVRRPEVPSSWHANSSSTAAVGSGSAANVVVRVGWVTPAGRFVQLGQSGGAAADVLAAETGSAPARSGSESVDGVSWEVYPSRRDEVAWAGTLDGVVVVITGSGTEQEFRQLAAAVAAAEPLPD